MTGGAAIVSLLALLATAKEKPLIVFNGNAVIVDEVYRAVLDLPSEAAATNSNARLVRTRLLDFLHRAGYELATVTTRVENGQIVADIDEGRLDKVIILGEGAVQTLRLKLELSLPANVFNRPLLERQLTAMSKKYQLRAVHWELVPVRPVKSYGPQLEKLAPIQEFRLGPMGGMPLILPASVLELRVYLEHYEWSVGLSPELSFDTSEGIGAGLDYHDRDLLFTADRWSLHTRLAATTRSSIDDNTTRVLLSRALAETHWFTPPFVGDEVRTFLALGIDMRNRQRKDLGVDSYFYAPIEALLDLDFHFLPQLTLSLGGGVQHRILFALERAQTVPVSPLVDATRMHETRPFANAFLDVVLNPDEIRRDRKHELNVQSRFFTKPEEARRSTVRLDYTYQAMLAIGWHELWLKSRGTLYIGEVLFPDELSVGADYLRGPFSDTFYVRKVAALGLELRFSVVRDLVKVSAFHDLATFGRLDHTRDTEDFAVADAFGGGLHLLLLDAFQFDAYFGVGFASGEMFDEGFVLRIEQAF